jgi:hypothetical protein
MFEKSEETTGTSLNPAFDEVVTPTEDHVEGSAGGGEPQFAAPVISDDPLFSFPETLPSPVPEFTVEYDPNAKLSHDPWEIRGLQDAIATKNQELPWVVNSILLAESATLVSAQPHAMKSLSLLAGSMEAVATGKFWGHFDAPDVDSTLFIETEDPQWLVEARIRGLAKGLGLSDKEKLPGFHYACTGPFDILAERGRLEDLIGHYQPKIIVLSTLQNLLHDRNWLSQQDMQPIMAEVIRISRQCPVILVTHSPWDKKQKRPAGTITQAANFATALHNEKRYSKNLGSYVQVSVDSKVGMAGTGFRLQLQTDGPLKEAESVRKLVFAGEGKWQSSRQIVEEALEDDPHTPIEELMELTQTGRRNIEKLLKEIVDNKKRSRGVRAA